MAELIGEPLPFKEDPHSPFQETTPYDRRQQPVVYLHVSPWLRFASQDGSRAHSTVTPNYRNIIGILTLHNSHAHHRPKKKHDNDKEFLRIPVKTSIKNYITWDKVKLSLCLAKYHAMKLYWGVEL